MTEVLRTHFIARTFTDLSTDSLAPRLIIKTAPRVMTFKNRKYCNNNNTNNDNNDTKTKALSKTSSYQMDSGSNDDNYDYNYSYNGKSDSQSPPSSPLKPKPNDSSAATTFTDLLSPIATTTRSTWLNIKVMMYVFLTVAIMVGICTVTLIASSHKLVDRCKSHSHYDLVEGTAYVPDPCAVDEMLPYIHIYMTVAGAIYVNQYGVWGPSRGWMITLISVAYFVCWLIIGLKPSFLVNNEMMRSYCENYGKMATAHHSHCTDLVLIESWRKWNMYFWSAFVSIPFYVERLYKIGGIREVFSFFLSFVWGVFSFVMVTLMIPVLEEQRKEDISVFIIRFVYLPVCMIISDMMTRVLAKISDPKNAQKRGFTKTPGASTFATHLFRVLYFLEIRILLLRLDTVGPVLLVNFGVILKDLVGKVGLREPMVYLYRFSHGDEKSELQMSTRIVRQQRVIEQISQMSCDYFALVLVLTVSLMGNLQDVNGEVVTWQSQATLYGLLILCQIIADALTMIVDVMIHHYDYIQGWKNYFKGRIFVTQLLVLLSMVPMNFVVIMSHYCFDIATIDGKISGYGMKTRTKCPITHALFAKHAVHLIP